MLNAEKFKNELSEILSENRYIEVNKYDRKIRKCTGNNCPKCMFGITALGKGRDSCSIAAMLWLLSEYKEPVKLTELEHGILEYLLEKRQYRFVVRERSGIIYVYKSNPKKEADSWGSLSLNHELGLFNNLFQFVQWGDSEPTSIEDVLNNCEVVNDAEE